MSAATPLVLAMDDIGSLALGWLGVFGVLGAYAGHLVRKGRRLSRIVPDEDKPWT
jgi:hypothetical protein